jgi:hypothetical protein
MDIGVIVIIFIALIAIEVFITALLSTPFWIAGPRDTPRWRKLLAYAVAVVMVLAVLFLVFLRRFV